MATLILFLTLLAFQYTQESKYDYDDLGRPQNIVRDYKSLGVKLNTATQLSSISYLSDGSKTTEYIGIHSVGNYDFKYTYTQSGQIKSVTKNGATQSYDYDQIGRLSKVSNPSTTTEYAYDICGNVTSKTVNGVEKEFKYNNGYLSNYDGHNYGYDDYGNPVYYKSKDFKEQNMTWRQSLLQGYIKADGSSVYYGYNKDGLRTRRYEKASNGNTLKNNREYIYDGTKLIAERWSDTSTSVNVNYNYYLYDAGGITGFVHAKYNNNTLTEENCYTITMDTFGTVHEIKHVQGLVVAKFSYDEWGKCTLDYHHGSTAIADNFPFRWKSHYLDKVTGFYYIGGRWYDPDIGRFINPTAPEGVLASAGVIGGANRYGFNLNDYVAAAGNQVNIASPYDLTPPLARRYTKTDRYLGYLKAVLIFIDSALLFAPLWWSGIGIIVSLGIAGIILGSIITLCVSYLLLESLASVGEAFCGHGYNFMRDGLYRGNAQLHRTMAIIAVCVLLLASLATLIVRSIQAAMSAKAQSVLNAADDNIPYRANPESLSKAMEGNPTFDVFRKRYWKAEALRAPELYGNNVANMLKKGAAPVINGDKLVLHHVVGRSVGNMYNVVVLPQSQHIAFHMSYGYQPWQYSGINLWT